MSKIAYFRLGGFADCDDDYGADTVSRALRLSPEGAPFERYAEVLYWRRILTLTLDGPIPRGWAFECYVQDGHDTELIHEIAAGAVAAYELARGLRRMHHNGVR